MFKILLLAVGILAVSAVPASAQRAPNLRSVSVVAVTSTGYPSWDYIRAGDFVTPKNHSGGELIVVTFDDGYSLSQNAKFLGKPMQQYKYERYPSTGPITGWLRYWYVNTPFTSGTFQ